MGEAQACARSLGATLIAASSSLALFLAANWKEFLLEDDPEIDNKNVLRVRTMRARLRSKGIVVDPRTVAIISLCPILIEIPHMEIPHMEPVDNRFDVASDLGHLCPLQLLPKSSAEDIRCSASRIRGFIQLRKPGPEDYMFRVEDAIAGDLANREALLVAGLVPEFSQLSYLRSRSTFQSLITGLQAAGYMLSLLQRLMQHLDISPLELFVAFYNVLTMSQLAMDLYACGHYQQPLLLRLRPSQFSQYCEIASNPFCDVPRRVAVVWLVGQLLALLLLCVPHVLHTIRYVHSCPDCVGASGSYFVASVLSIALLGLIISVQYHQVASANFNKQVETGLLFSWFASGAVFYITWVMSVRATIKRWDLFKMATTNDWFAWVLPHVSS